VPPYVVRPWRRLGLHAPGVDELETEFRLEDFTLVTAPRRLSRSGPVPHALSGPRTWPGHRGPGRML